MRRACASPKWGYGGVTPGKFLISRCNLVHSERFWPFFSQFLNLKNRCFVGRSLNFSHFKLQKLRARANPKFITFPAKFAA